MNPGGRVAYNETVNRVVHPSVLNLHAEPEPSSDLVSQLLVGAAVQVLEERDGWGYVQGPDGYRGWASLDGCLPLAEAVPSEGESARIATPYANLRYRPCRRAGPLRVVSFGTTLSVAGREAEWVGLRLPDGSIGWVEEKRTEPALPCPASPDAVLQTARLLLGVPYLWGGVSGFGIDCSGFAQAVFRRHGFDLPRDAHQQAEIGAPVARESVRAGDLLYFAASPDAPRRRITHVGIAVDTGNMIHALGGDSVVENSIDSVEAYWGARRILGEWVSGTQ